MKDDTYAFTPPDFLHYLRHVRGLSSRDTRLPRRLLLVFGGDSWEALRRRTRGRGSRWNPWVALGRAGGRRVAVARSTIGAPAAATVLEESIALGAQEVVTFGACGSLSEQAKIGSAVLPTFAVPDEGTSRHYGRPRQPRPDPSLLRAIRSSCRRIDVGYVQGGVWTTDAPYREPWAKARMLSRKGVVAVDMEASALYAVASVRGIRAASLFVVSDELGTAGWNPGFEHSAFESGTRKALNVLVDVMSRPFP